MEIKSKNILLNLNKNEEIVYVEEKNKTEFYCFAPIVVCLGAPFLSFFLIASFFTPLKHSWIIFPLWIFIIYLSYAYIRDYFFTEIVLTNQRLIISRFNKPIFVDYNQIKSIWGFSLVNAPSVTTIKVNPKKFYRIHFINELKLRNKIKEIYPEHNINELIVGKSPWWSWTIAIIFVLGLIFTAVYLRHIH